MSSAGELRLADSFTDGLARLTSDEQKPVKTTAFDLRINPTRLQPPSAEGETPRCGARETRKGSGEEVRSSVHR
jgi:hypothetical protein